jgi:predicted RNase H-like HicB family nuclease
MDLHLELDREADGRWIAEVVELPGAMACGPTRERAEALAKALALCVVADRLDAGEARLADLDRVSFPSGRG